MSSMTREELEQMYNSSIKVLKEGQVVTGKVVGIKSKEVLVDVGFKSEGIVPITEFSSGDLEIGKEMEFLLETMEAIEVFEAGQHIRRIIKRVNR